MGEPGGRRRGGADGRCPSQSGGTQEPRWAGDGFSEHVDACMTRLGARRGCHGVHISDGEMYGRRNLSEERRDRGNKLGRGDSESWVFTPCNTLIHASDGAQSIARAPVMDDAWSESLVGLARAEWLTVDYAGLSSIVSVSTGARPFPASCPSSILPFSYNTTQHVPSNTPLPLSSPADSRCPSTVDVEPSASWPPRRRTRARPRAPLGFYWPRRSRGVERE